MHINKECYQVPHQARRNWLPISLVRAAAIEWPDANWAWWMQYKDDHALKRASRGRDGIPRACQMLLDRMAEIDVAGLLRLPSCFPDLSLHGGGLHEIPPGGFLAKHLDASHHPTRGWARAASVVLFIDPWQPEWGGGLRLGGVTEPILPYEGMLVAMATNDESYHEVLPVTGPMHRRTLAMFWWTEQSLATSERREKAKFVLE